MYFLHTSPHQVPKHHRITGSPRVREGWKEKTQVENRGPKEGDPGLTGPTVDLEDETRANRSLG